MKQQIRCAGVILAALHLLPLGGCALDVTNPRNFGSNAGNVIWEDTASLWAAMPEAGNPVAGHPVKY